MFRWWVKCIVFFPPGTHSLSHVSWTNGNTESRHSGMLKMLMGTLPGTITDGLEEERLMNLCKRRDNSSYIIKSILFKCTIYNGAWVRFSLQEAHGWLDTVCLSPLLLRAVKKHCNAFKMKQSPPIKLLWLFRSFAKNYPVAAVTR